MYPVVVAWARAHQRRHPSLPQHLSLRLLPHPRPRRPLRLHPRRRQRRLGDHRVSEAALRGGQLMDQYVEAEGDPAQLLFGHLDLMNWPLAARAEAGKQSVLAGAVQVSREALERYRTADRAQQHHEGHLPPETLQQALYVAGHGPVQGAA